MPSYAHGLISSAATITSRANHLMEIKLQFNLLTVIDNLEDIHNINDKINASTDTMAHRAHSTAKHQRYTLSQLVALSDKQFSVLYKELITHLDKSLQVSIAGRNITLNKRYPSQQQVSSLIKREFIESLMSEKAKRSTPYTYNERRHYQVFYVGFKVNNEAERNALKVTFPDALGDLNVTYSESTTSLLHKGQVWIK